MASALSAIIPLEVLLSRLSTAGLEETRSECHNCRCVYWLRLNDRQADAPVTSPLHARSAAVGKRLSVTPFGCWTLPLTSSHR